MPRIFTAVLWVVASCRGSCAPEGPAVIRVDPSVSLQTMTGWEVTAQVGQLECDRALYQRTREEVYDRAVDELGINRVRIELRANAEHPVDWTQRLLDREIDFETWAEHRYDTQSGTFHFTELDHQMEHVVKPLAERLAKLGERLYLNACFVAFSGDFHRNHPEEYAKLVLAAFEHLRDRYQMVPDALEVILEPDVARWRPTDVANAIRAVGPRLAAAGFRPAIIAPSTSDMGAALDFFAAIARDDAARPWVTDFAYHRYHGTSARNLEAIGALPARSGVRTMMLEHIDSGDEELHADLATGNASAWQRYGLAFCAPEDDGSVHYLLGDTVRLGEESRFLPQYFRRVRLDAVRHAASSSTDDVAPLAFQREGRWTVVVRAPRYTAIRIEGLPEGEYQAEYTTDAELLRSTEVHAVAGAHEVRLPARGVITVWH